MTTLAQQTLDKFDELATATREARKAAELYSTTQDAARQAENAYYAAGHRVDAALHAIRRLADEASIDPPMMKRDDGTDAAIAAEVRRDLKDKPLA